MVSSGSFSCGCTYEEQIYRNPKFIHICWWHRNIIKARKHGEEFEWKKDKSCKCGCK